MKNYSILRAFFNEEAYSMALGVYFTEIIVHMIYQEPRTYRRTEREVVKDKILMREIRSIWKDIDLEMGEIEDFPVDNDGRKYFPYVVSKRPHKKK